MSTLPHIVRGFRRDDPQGDLTIVLCIPGADVPVGHDAILRFAAQALHAETGRPEPANEGDNTRNAIGPHKVPDREPDKVHRTIWYDLYGTVSEITTREWS